jgi:histidine triad (HIT) family protein
MTTGDCVFCQIAAGAAPASVVYEDAVAMCFMTLRPTRAGECLIVPKTHVDEFVDVPPALLGHLMEIARRVGLAMRAEYEPDRIGMIIHGYGVPHTHLILLPQHDPHDITSGRFAVSDSPIQFRHDVVLELPRHELDDHASRLAGRLERITGGAP